MPCLWPWAQLGDSGLHFDFGCSVFDNHLSFASAVLFSSSVYRVNKENRKTHSQDRGVPNIWIM